MSFSSAWISFLAFPRRLVLEDQVGPHAAAGEVPDALVVLGAVGVRVEVARAVVADVLEQLHQEERRLIDSAPKRKSWS